MMPFIVGVGRSGTTLLRLMLDAHPDLAMPPETHFIPSLLSMEKREWEDFFEIITNAPTWVDFRLDEDVFRQELRALPVFSLTEGLRTFYRLYARKFSKPLYGDKTPLYNLHMEAIQTLLPEARFIHLIRDGRDVALSYRGLWFGPGDDIESSARFWMNRISTARLQSINLNFYLEIHYEQLIADPVGTLSCVCDFLELPFSDKMLNYHHHSTARLSEFGDRFNQDGSVRVNRESRLSIFTLTQSAPDQSRCGRWKTEMTNAEQAQYENIAGELLNELGYETNFWQLP